MFTANSKFNTCIARLIHRNDYQIVYLEDICINPLRYIQHDWAFRLISFLFVSELY
jgi:hypothetical protein